VQVKIMVTISPVTPVTSLDALILLNLST
jgi:hypothetical protein